MGGEGRILWRGLQFGAVMAFVAMVPFNLIIQGVYDFPLSAIPMDILWALVEQGLGGLTIAFAQERIA